MLSPLTLFWVTLAGAAGTLGRYSLVVFVTRYLAMPSPWNIWLVNGLGCALFGLISVLLPQSAQPSSAELRAVLLIGFVAAFTTFSTQIFDAYTALQKGSWIMGAMHLFLQPVLGLLAMVLGQFLGNMLKKSF